MAPKKQRKTKKPQRRRRPSAPAPGIALVTGATSAIGAEVIRRLVQQGYEVNAIIRDRPEKNQDWRRLPKGVKPYVGDISLTTEANDAVLKEACRGVSLIFHFAAALQKNVTRLDSYMQVNVIGTENLLRAYLEANPDPEASVQIIYSSSTAVYGYKRKGETLTENSKTRAETPYGSTKLMSEQVIKAFAEANRKIKYTIFRMSVIYGPGYSYGFGKMFRLIKEGRMRIIGNGENHLVLVHVDDAVDAMMLSIGNKAAVNNTYNLTDGQTYTQRELFAKAAGFIGVAPPSKKVNAFIAKMLHKRRNFETDQFLFLTSDRMVSIERIKKDLGFRPRRSIDIDGRSMIETSLKYSAEGLEE